MTHAHPAPVTTTMPAIFLSLAMAWLAPPVLAAEAIPPTAIEIDADEGIEWRRDDMMVLATGNARAVRGDTTVYADVLTARYRENADGSTEIWRLDADGKVKILSANETVFADHGTYNLDRQVINLDGERVRLLTEGNEIVADDMEYWTEERKLIATGNAEATEGDRKIRAQVLTAFLAEEGSAAGDDSSRVSRVEATDDVWVITPQDVLRGDAGTYDATEELATLTGDVKITRGANQLNGCRSEVDLATGVSRLFACENDSTGTGRVRGLILPDTLDGK